MPAQTFTRWHVPSLLERIFVALSALVFGGGGCFMIWAARNPADSNTDHFVVCGVMVFVSLVLLRWLTSRTRFVLDEQGVRVHRRGFWRVRAHGPISWEELRSVRLVRAGRSSGSRGSYVLYALEFRASEKTLRVDDHISSSRGLTGLRTELANRGVTLRGF